VSHTPAGPGGGETSGVSLVVCVLLAGLLLGWLTGGSLDQLGGVPLRRRRLVLLALVTQALGSVVGGPAYPLGLLVSALLVAAFLATNRGIRGTGLVALGLLANAVVVGLNGAMPVSEVAAGRAGVSTQDLLTGDDSRHTVSGAQTRLPWLGDVIAVPLPLRPEVVSIGDVLVAAGLAQLVVLGMRRPEVAGSVAQRRGRGRPHRALPPLPSSPATGGPTARAATRPGSSPPRRLPARPGPSGPS